MPMPALLTSVRVRPVAVVWDCCGARGWCDASAAGRAEDWRRRNEELLSALGGVLPAGLAGVGCCVAGCIFIYPGAAGASVTAGFAAVSEFGLVVWRVAGDWGTGYEQLSLDDG